MFDLHPLPDRKRCAQAQQTCRETLLAVGLKEDQFRALPRTLSGGEQQRVAIARTLAAGSPIVLADKPTGSLDSKNSENVVGMLKHLAHEEGRCVIVVTHNPKVADHADTVLRMQDEAFE